MNRNICTDKYGTCEDGEKCDCHSEEIKAEIEMERAVIDYHISLRDLKSALENLGRSNKAKLEAIEKIKPFLEELNNLTK